MVRFRARMLALWLPLLLAACGGTRTLPPANASPHTPSLALTFAPSVPYEQALREVTDLGMQPGFDCGAAGLWQPMDQHTTFAHTHRLFVWFGYLTAPDDWSNRLAALPGVTQSVQGEPYYPYEPSSGGLTPTGVTPDAASYLCPQITGPTPTAETPVPWTAGQPWIISRITFTAPLDTYDAALAAISEQGLGLADPCFEQAQLANASPTWHPMGQEDSFASSHTLVVQTNKSLTSSLWQQQLQATPGVSQIDQPFTAHC